MQILKPTCVKETHTAYTYTLLVERKHIFCTSGTGRAHTSSMAGLCHASAGRRLDVLLGGLCHQRTKIRAVPLQILQLIPFWPKTCTLHVESFAISDAISLY